MDPEEVVEEQPVEPVVEPVEPVQPVEPVALEIDYGRLADEIAARSQPVQPAAPAGDPYSMALLEATEAGREFDTGFITARAIAIGIQQSKTELLSQLAPFILPAHNDLQATQLAGADPHARDFANKFIAKGMDINDPDIRDLIQRGAKSYAQEKTPAKVVVNPEHRGEPAPVLTSDARQQAHALTQIAGVADLTDEEIAEAMAS